MTRTILVTFSLIIFGLNLSSQSDTLNMYNSKGKKTGYWLIFLNDKLDPIDKKENAFYSGYESWDNGKPVFGYYKHPFSKNKMPSDQQPEKGNPLLVSGTFKWYDKNGILMVKENL